MVASTSKGSEDGGLEVEAVVASAAAGGMPKVSEEVSEMREVGCGFQVEVAACWFDGGGRLIESSPRILRRRTGGRVGSESLDSISEGFGSAAFRGRL